MAHFLHCVQGQNWLGGPQIPFQCDAQQVYMGHVDAYWEDDEECRRNLATRTSADYCTCRCAGCAMAQHRFGFPNYKAERLAKENEKADRKEREKEQLLQLQLEQQHQMQVESHMRALLAGLDLGKDTITILCHNRITSAELLRNALAIPQVLTMIGIPVGDILTISKV